jgi:hypothetical protein
VSDNAGAFSVPLPNQINPPPKGVSLGDYARVMTRALMSCDPVEVPTGSGFCMYIRRDLLEDIGNFDEIAFPRGYGEENDFCMRALSRGWVNLIAPASFVYHVRSASFGAERQALVANGVRTVMQRFPDYAIRVAVAFQSPQWFRVQLAAHTASCTMNADWVSLYSRLSGSPAECSDADSSQPILGSVSTARGVCRLAMFQEQSSGSPMEIELADPDCRQVVADWLLRNSVDQMLMDEQDRFAVELAEGVSGMLGVAVQKRGG